MEDGITYGVIGLEDKDLVLIKSALKLRSERWNWTAAAERASLLFVDLTHPLAGKALSRPDDGRLYLVIGSESAPQASVEAIGRPIKAAHLMRAIDRLMGRRPPADSAATAGTPPAPPPVAAVEPPSLRAPVHPWEGRRIRLLRAPSLSKFPVTAEMLDYVQAACREPVSYDRLVRALPLDRPLLDAMLNDAARNGHLVDEHGASLPAHDAKRSGLMRRLLGKS